MNIGDDLFGVPLVAGANLLRQFGYMQVDGRLPPGTFEVRDTANLDRDPTRDNLGTEILLVYNESV